MGKIKVIGGEIGMGSWSTSFLFGTAKMSRNFDTETVELKIKNAEVQTEEKLKKLAGSAGWGFAGALVGGVLTGGIGLLIGGLAGVLSGGNKSEVCFSCELQDGRKFLAITDKKTWQNILALTFSTTQSIPSETIPSLPPEIPRQDESSSISSMVDAQQLIPPSKPAWMDLTQQERDKISMRGLLSVGGLLLLVFVGVVVETFSSSPTDVTSPSSAPSTQTSSEQPSTMQKTFLGNSETGYGLYLGSDDCIYVKGITEGDLARLNTTVGEYKDVVKQETGKRCVYFE